MKTFEKDSLSTAKAENEEWRNKAIFDSNFQMPYNTTKTIIDAAIEWSKAQGFHSDMRRTSTISLVRLKPNVDWLKLNVDGARQLPSRRIGAGGVLRDHDGCWISGFTASRGIEEVLDAEAWGMLLGLQMAVSITRGKLIVESDSEVLVNLIKKGTDDLHPLKAVLNNCRSFMEQFQEIEIRHIYRELNMVADLLSKCSLGTEFGINFFEQPPPQVTAVLLDDLCAVLRRESSIHLVDFNPDDPTANMQR